MGKSQAIGIGLIGCGTVGSGVVKLLLEEHKLYAQRIGLPVQLKRVLVRQQDLNYKTERVPAKLLTTDPESFFNTPGLDIVIELAGGSGVISQYVRRALTAGKHVVTANKALLASEGLELFHLAHKHGVALAFEASCCGGIPIITALQFGLMANQISALYGILNGTCNYILSEMTQQNKTYATALKEAQEKGFAEANPTLDVSGHDAAHKLAILASLAFGVRAATGDKVQHIGIDSINQLDVRLGDELGYRIKLLGIAERTEQGTSLGVQPCFIHKDTLLAQVHGSFNALSVFGHATGQTFYYGRGAGMMPTAGAVMSDVMNIAASWYPQAFATMKLWPDQQAHTPLLSLDNLESRFYIRVNGLDKPGTMAHITQTVGAANISISGVMQHENNAGRFVPVVIMTHRTRFAILRSALAKLARLKVVHGNPVCIRVVDLPNG